MKQQKSEKAFRQAVNKVITDDSRESELLKQKQIIAGCKNKLAASGMLLCKWFKNMFLKLICHSDSGIPADKFYYRHFRLFG